MRKIVIETGNRLFHLITFASPVLSTLLNRGTGPLKLVTNLFVSENGVVEFRRANDMLLIEVLNFCRSFSVYSKLRQAIYLGSVA
jgi:hypothetical protein